VIAREEIASAIADINGVMNLAPGGIGSRMALEMVRTGEIIRIGREIIKPFYQRKAFQTLELFRQELGDVPYRIHKPEGALFLWVWFQDLPCTATELYERLKERNCLVVPGSYFFPGLENETWQHKHECIRVSYAQDDAVVAEGVKVIADEVKNLYAAE
jgi:valine--pyruvate aminotransferase